MATYLETIGVKTINPNKWVESTELDQSTLPENTVGIRIDDNGETMIAFALEMKTELSNKFVRIVYYLCKQGTDGSYYKYRDINCYIDNNTFVNDSTGQIVTYEESHDENDNLLSGYEFQYDWYYNLFMKQNASMEPFIVQSLVNTFTDAS